MVNKQQLEYALWYCILQGLVTEYYYNVIFPGDVSADMIIPESSVSNTKRQSAFTDIRVQLNHGDCIGYKWLDKY